MSVDTVMSRIDAITERSSALARVAAPTEATEAGAAQKAATASATRFADVLDDATALAGSRAGDGSSTAATAARTPSDADVVAALRTIFAAGTSAAGTTASAAALPALSGLGA